MLIFLAPDEGMRAEFLATAKRYLALKKIKSRESELNLTSEQRRKISQELSEFEDRRRSRLYLALRNLYRIVVVPSTRDFKEYSLGKAPSPELRFWEEIKGILLEKKQLFEKISPNVIFMRYLQNAEDGYIGTSTLYEQLLRNPGEPRPLSKEALILGIKEGVERGIFGLGKLQDEKPVCWKFRSAVSPTLNEGEIIIKPEICKQQFEEREREKEVTATSGRTTVVSPNSSSTPTTAPGTLVQTAFEGEAGEITKVKGYSKLKLDLEVPIEDLYTLSTILDYLNQKFRDITLEVRIEAEGGAISFTEYEDKILEAIMQSKIRIKDKYFEKV